MHNTVNTERTIEEIYQDIEQVEQWLKDNPYADWESRYDMIDRLRQLNEELNPEKP